MVRIRKNIVKNPKSIYGFNNKKKKITIHETDNTSKGANADAHARLQQNGYSASWHYQVDDKEIVQSFDHSAQCFHAGDGRGPGNLDSIGIEMCVNSDGDYLKTVDNTIWLVKKIMKEEGLTANDVVQHNHWSGKNCPRRLRAGSHGVTWKEFKDKLVKGSTDKDELYRVRKSWKDTKSQLGAYKILDNAIKKARDNKGYKVYDSKGNIVGESTIKSIDKIPEDGWFGPQTATLAQEIYGLKIVDGIVSGQPRNSSTENIPSAQFGTSGSNLILAMQKEFMVPKHLCDRKITNPSRLVLEMQKYYGTPQDSRISGPSMVIKEWQKALNKGKRK